MDPLNIITSWLEILNILIFLFYSTGGKDPGWEEDVTIIKRSSDRETPIFLRHLQGASYTDTGKDDVVDDNSTDEMPEDEEKERNCTPASK